MISSFPDTVATLSDRALRRLLGPRAFLRGYDYARRHAVSGIEFNKDGAHAVVQGVDQIPYNVQLGLAQEGITSHCDCPIFARINTHCKHVAALLITIRQQLRAARASSPNSSEEYTEENYSASTIPTAGEFLNGSQAASSANSKQRKQRRANNNERAEASEGTSRRSRRNARRSRSAIASERNGYSSGRQSSNGLESGLDVWFPDVPINSKLPELEFRISLRPSSLSVAVFDPTTRSFIVPSEALNWQTHAPTAERSALRLLARFERTENRNGIAIQGEDAAELLTHLRGRRVLLEPSLMQLRWSEEPLRVRFDFEVARRSTNANIEEGSTEPEQVWIRASFERVEKETSSPERVKKEGRRFQLSTGTWFEGAPGWQIDPIEGIARPLDVRVTPAWFQRLWANPQILYPLSDLPILLSNKLPRLASELGAELPSLREVADEIDVPPRFKLRALGELIEAHVYLSAAYGDTELEVRADGMSPPILVFPPSEPGQKARCVRTNILEQQQAVERLRGLGLVPDEQGKGLICRGDDAIRFWTEGLGSLPEDWEFFVPEDLVGVQFRAEEVGARARVSSGVDWLSVKITFQVSGITVPTEELTKCLSEGRRYVKLEDGSFARIDIAKVREVLARQAEIVAGSKDGKVSLAQAGRVQELLEHVASAQLTNDAKELFDKLHTIEKIETVRKPRNLKATLRPYQESGLAWLAFLHELGSGGVLADDMGLGKTVQTLALLLHLKNERKKKEDTSERAVNLIVCPTSVVSNWLAEVEKFAPSLNAMAWHGSDRHDKADEIENHDIVVTSYALLRRDEEQLSKLKLAYAILDEAQHIKNPMSATARAAKKLNAYRRLTLTGTPIENRLSEIWSIFDFVAPNLLGELSRFEQRYANPIDRGDSKAAARLKATIHPFVLRRTKEEVANDLPEKIEIVQPVEMAPEQVKLYAQVLQEVRASVLGEVERVGIAKAQIQILAALTRLRQVACDPRLLGLPRTFSNDDSGKLSALRELISEAYEGGHRVILFSQFVSMLSLVRKVLEEDGIKYEYLDGSTKDRQERVQRFQSDPTVVVFLISLKAGGTGLNITAADTVIHFDPWWNPAVEDQATARAHRIGQTKVVTAYKLVAKGTIEEKILQLTEKKRSLVESILSEDAGGSKKLTKQDLDDLFGEG